MSRSSYAAPYPVDIQIDEEADIHQLYYDGEIDEDLRDHLVTLFMSKVDVNTASRDLLYDVPGMTYDIADAIIAARKAAHIADISQIKDLPEMTPEIWQQAEPFLIAITEEDAKRFSGNVTLGGIGRSQHGDPSFFTRAETRFLTYGSAGILLAVRPMIGTVQSAEPGTSLSASPEKLRFDPGSLYVSWDTPEWSMIAGDFRVGYGLGVTIDNSRRSRPDGAYPNVDLTENIDSGALTTLDGFKGLALRAKEIQMGPGWLDISAFGSYWTRDMYYTDVYYDRCPVGQPNCTTQVPSLVDSTTGDSLYCEYPTYPRIMRELVGGANMTYWLDGRTAFGITGYVAQWDMRANAANIQPSPSSRYPGDRSLWGAVGANGRYGFGIIDVSAEAAVTDQGHPGMLIKGWITPLSGLEIIPSFRYYSPGYDNPYARAEADADEYLGLRSRDELGGRLVLNWRPVSFLRLRADIDVWHHRYPGQTCDPTISDSESPLFCGESTDAGASKVSPSTDMEALFRAQILPTAKERLTIWGVYHDEDLSRDGRDLSYRPYSNNDGDFSGGSRIYWAVSAATSRIPRVELSAMFKQIFEDTYAVKDDFERSWYTWIRASTNLAPGPRVAVRVKFYDESTNASTTRSAGQICDDEERGMTYPGGLPGICRGETYWETTLQLTQRLNFLGKGSALRLRGGWSRWVDHRSKWTYGIACTDKPSRDEFMLKGNLEVKF